MKWAGRESDRKVLRDGEQIVYERVNETQTGRILARENGQAETGAERELDRQGEGDRQTEAARQQWRERQRRRAEQTGDRGGQRWRGRETRIEGGAGERKEVNRDMDGSEQRGEARGVWCGQHCVRPPRGARSWMGLPGGTASPLGL